MKITPATAQMIPHLQEIWMDSFGEDKASTAYIFQHLIHPAQILTCTADDGVPLSMLCLQPFVLSCPAGEAQGVYLYGVATRPEHRGQGLSTKLLEACHPRLASQGVALSALVPANDGLFEFYRARGYQTAFYLTRPVWKATEIPAAARPCILTATSLEKMCALRNSFYSDRAGFVRWDSKYLAYINAECKMLGGEVLRIGCGGEVGYAVCYRTKTHVTIKELVLPEHLLGDALAAFHARFNAEEYQIYLPADLSVTRNKVLPFAMVQWYDKKKQERFDSAKGKAPWLTHGLD